LKYQKYQKYQTYQKVYFLVCYSNPNRTRGEFQLDAKKVGKSIAFLRNYYRLTQKNIADLGEIAVNRRFISNQN
jgi:hypothetical protein